jgi:hypothetical protein
VSNRPPPSTFPARRVPRSWPTAVGISLLAVVRLKYAGSRHEPFLQHLQGSPQFLDCLRVTGEDCYVIKLGVVYSQSLAPRGPSRSLANL